MRSVGRGAALVMPTLVVNADDAGLHARSDAAILRCFEAGIVRSATVIANGATAEEFVPRARDTGLDLGLHLNLTEGRALTGPIPGLTDDNGTFRGPTDKRAAIAVLWAAEVSIDAELAAQLARLRDMGVEPTHIDGHNHVQMAPCVLAAIRRACPDLFVRVSVEPDGRGPRWFPVDAVPEGAFRRTDCFLGHALSTSPTRATLDEALAACHGTVEWMVHPGRWPGSIFRDSPDRDAEVALLCDPDLQADLAASGWRIASFADLRREGAA